VAPKVSESAIRQRLEDSVGSANLTSEVRWGNFDEERNISEGCF
jgi:hypothetical protein